MKAVKLILAGGIGLAALTAAAPAAAQYYPGNPYGYQNNNVVGQVLGQILGYGRYPYGNYGYQQYGGQSMAVDQCARAVEARVSRDNRRGVYGRWNSAYGHQGYGNQGHYGQAQVVGITGVQRQRNGLRVTGLIDTRMGPRLGGYGQYNQYGQAYPGYPNQGYGQPGYGNQGYNAAYANLRFSCRVDYRGRVSDLDIRRNTNRRG